VKKLKQALVNPAAVFAEPKEVVVNPTFSRQQKIDVLRRWEHDTRLFEASAKERLTDASEALLGEILESLHELDYWPDLEHPSSNKVSRLARSDLKKNNRRNKPLR
jgi:hypothetical protein